MSVDAEKRRFPRADALNVARACVAALRPACSELIIAGSLRRRKAEVGDVEVLYIPKIIEIADPEDFFGQKIKANAVDLILSALASEGLIGKRLNKDGHTTWGDRNKLAVHGQSGIPIDFFSATPENWWNLLVCRTGGAESNTAIAAKAKAAGWKWRPYGPGFSRDEPHGKGPDWSTWYVVKSERAVFDFIGLKYREPWERQ
jgi:DNA polymerase/3'-5' exonuclease PolX